MEPSTTIAGKLETTKTKLSPPDKVFVSVSDSPYQPKIFKDFRERIQQKDHFKQYSLNDLSGYIMTREEMRLESTSERNANFIYFRPSVCEKWIFELKKCNGEKERISKARIV